VSAPVLALRERRCSNHPQREASARCPECKNYFCRECITEHDDRVLCASCLAKLSGKKDEALSRWMWAPRLALALLAIAAIYIAILLCGNMLLSIPSQFHATGGW
jgi:uncharacterized paraquat-inducible protein A